MPISDNMLRDGFNGCVQSIHGQVVTILSGVQAGSKFTATLLVDPVVEFQGEVTQDSRERCVAHFAIDSWPDRVLPGDTMLDEYGNTWRFVKRVNNQNDSSNDFEVMKLINGIDA